MIHTLCMLWCQSSLDYALASLGTTGHRTMSSRLGPMCHSVSVSSQTTAQKLLRLDLVADWRCCNSVEEKKQRDSSPAHCSASAGSAALGCAAAVSSDTIPPRKDASLTTCAPGSCARLFHTRPCSHARSDPATLCMLCL